MVEHRGIHHLRHAYVTMLTDHADARMTREIYTHVTAPMFEAPTDAIAQAVDGTFGSSTDATGSTGSKTADPPAPGDDPPAATSR